MADTVSNWVVTPPTLNLAGAKRALEAAEAEARTRELRLCIAVADAAGNLLAFQRMDGALLISVSASIEKARTAALLGCATRQLQDVVDGGTPSLLSLRAMTPLEGGVPIVIDGAVVGAVAASGAAPADDAHVAQCGVDAIVGG